jgi:hypothetical protein
MSGGVDRGLEATALPMVPEELTADWLSAALGREVTAVETSEIVWGTATKVRLNVSYADEPDAWGPPAALCAKGGFDERLRGYDLAPAYLLEASFFGDLAPELDARLPRCWYAGLDPEHGQGIVVLDDLVATGCSFGEPTEAWSPDRVSAGLEVQARWHAQTWGSSPGNRDWLTVGSSSVRAAAAVLLGSQHWEQHFAQEGAPALPASLRDSAAIKRAFEGLWSADDAGANCLAHGDAHIGNTYVDADGNPGFLDWQAVCLGPWSYDVAYFIGGALSVADRRAHERDLVNGYLDALASSGGPRIDAEAAWLEYRRHALHGFLWAVTPAVMQPLERVVAMAERHVAAIEDLDSLGALAA